MEKVVIIGNFEMDERRIRSAVVIGLFGSLTGAIDINFDDERPTTRYEMPYRTI